MREQIYGERCRGGGTEGSRKRERWGNIEREREVQNKREGERGRERERDRASER